MDISAKLDAAVALIRDRLPEATAIYLYGSQARGDTRPDSDVDLAVLTKGGTLDALRLWDVRGDLTILLGLPVDLVHLNTASTVLQREVMIDGRLLYDADPLATGLFEVFVFREYADLKYRRRDIEADIVARGYVLARA